MKTTRTGIFALGASLLAMAACTGSAFTSVDEVEQPDGDVDASLDAGFPLDARSEGGSDAEAGTDASSGDADAAKDGASDVDADAGDADASDADDDDAGDADPDDAGDEDDAGADADESDASDGDACSPSTWYRDDDGDGWGGEDSVEGCAPPPTGTWVKKGGDCHDGDKNVHPGQTSYFATAYTKPGINPVESFDYDCNGSEKVEGTPAKSDGTCSLLSGLCSGSGYLAPSPKRTGAGVDPYCGSTVYFTCSLGVGCTSSTTTKPPIRCR